MDAINFCKYVSKGHKQKSTAKVLGEDQQARKMEVILQILNAKDFSPAVMIRSFLSQSNHLIDVQVENEIHVATRFIKPRVAAQVCSQRQSFILDGQDRKGTEGRIQEIAGFQRITYY